MVACIWWALLKGFAQFVRSDVQTEMQAAVPVADIIYKHLEQAKDEGHGEKDWGSIALVVREQSSS